MRIHLAEPLGEAARHRAVEHLGPDAAVNAASEVLDELAVNVGARGRKALRGIDLDKRRGEIITKVQVTDRVPPGLIWMSFHYADSPTNAITSDVVDPITKTGEYKICGVRVEKIQGA